MEKLSMSDSSVKATCHCGAITVTAPRKPESINECQCSICRRYSAAWIYYPVNEVEIQKKEGSSTRKYIWGDKMIEFHFCENCGCVVYWWPISEELDEKMGINSRNIDPDLLRGINRNITYMYDD